VAPFDALVAQGKVGLSYRVDVHCVTVDPSAPPLPLLTGALPVPLLTLAPPAHASLAPAADAASLLSAPGNFTIAPCPPGTQASSDLRFCEPCKGGEFNLLAGGTCLACPMGATCPAGDRLEALPNWW
jgi:hypothetical protein